MYWIEIVLSSRSTALEVVNSNMLSSSGFPFWSNEMKTSMVDSGDSSNSGGVLGLVTETL